MDSCYQNNLSQSQKKCIEKTTDNVITLSSRSKPQQCILNGEFVENISGMYKDDAIGNTSNKTYSTSHKNSIETQLREGAITMDDNKILEKYMDKVDQDRRDMERRITEERRLSEERMENRFNKVMDNLEKTNNKIDMTQKEIQKEVKTSIQDLTDKLDSTYKWIIGTCIATILGIAGLVISIILTR